MRAGAKDGWSMTARSTAACMLRLPARSIFSTAGRTARDLAILQDATVCFSPFLLLVADADANSDGNDDDTDADNDSDDDEADDGADKDDANGADADAANRWGWDSLAANFRFFAS